MGAALAMSLLGIIFVSLSGGGLPEGASLLGLICGIASGIAFALQFIVVKYFLQFCTTEQIYGYAFLTAAVVFFPCIAFSEKTIEVWGALAGIGIVASFGGFLLYGLALSILRSTQVAAIVNIDPVFSTAWAFLFFGELLPPLGILGALLVLGGVGLTVLGSEQERAENPATVQATTL